jgi:hypothetical protein
MDNIFYHMTAISSNAKTGAIAVSTTSQNSCPSACNLKGAGCYAESGNLGIHWRAVAKHKTELLDNGKKARGLTLDEFCDAIESLPKKSIFRHNQAGDLPSLDGENINGLALRTIVASVKNRKLRAFTYTHYKPQGENLAELEHAISNGFTINLSANSLDEADKFKALGFPVAVVLPANTDKGLRSFNTEKGNKVVVCPTNYNENITCSSCLICANSSKERAIVGFVAHGVGKNKATIASASESAKKLIMLKQVKAK